jgi:hypothetical protein
MLYREIIKTPKGLQLSEPFETPDNEDPFLCAKCQQHGYCIEKFYKHPNTNELMPIPQIKSKDADLFNWENNAPATESEISNMVNVRTDINEASNRLGKKLQQAHDLFHQDEFEQASYIYLDIIETRTEISEAWKGICASFYFLGKYEEAVAASMNRNTSISSSFMNKFIKACEMKMNQAEEKLEELEGEKIFAIEKEVNPIP